MKAKLKDYAEGFLAVTAGKSGASLESTLHHFVEFIRKNGDWSKRREIVEYIESVWRKKNGSPLLRVTSARELSEAHLHAIKKKFLGYATETLIDPSLVAGARLRTEDQELDLSLQTTLKKLF